jgi:hypothetical protein
VNIFFEQTQMNEVRQLWQTSGYVVPSVLLGLYNNEYYLTVSDHQSIITFASKRKGIYVASKRKCRVVSVGLNEVKVYQIEEADALQVISCKKPITALDAFVTTSLVPIILQGQ